MGAVRHAAGCRARPHRAGAADDCAHPPDLISVPPTGELLYTGCTPLGVPTVALPLALPAWRARSSPSCVVERGLRVGFDLTNAHWRRCQRARCSPLAYRSPADRALVPAADLSLHPTLLSNVGGDPLWPNRVERITRRPVRKAPAVRDDRLVSADKDHGLSDLGRARRALRMIAGWDTPLGRITLATAP